MAHVPLHDASHASLPEEAQAAVDEFLDGVKNKTRFGLWVFGPHNSGTTYVGRVAVRMLGRLDGIDGWEHFYAREMVSEIRQLWTMDTLVRANPNDYTLWTEWNDRQQAVDYVWKGLSVLFLNDFDTEAVDISFWRKHVHPPVIERVKEGRPTIIATTLEPGSDQLVGLQAVIDREFVVCACAER